MAKKPQDEDIRLLPADVTTEKLVLGSALLNADHLATVVAIPRDCFSREDRRRVHDRMIEMHERRETVDKVTLVDALRKYGQLESVGGMTGVMELEEGLPQIPAIDSYIAILKEFAGRRRIIVLGQTLTENAYLGEQSPTEILEASEPTWRDIEASGTQKGDGGQTPTEVIESFPGGINAFLDPSQRLRGLPTGFTIFDEMTGGMKPGEVIIIAARPSHGKSAIALNIAHHLAIHPKQRRFVAFFSLEMSSESLILRMACAGGRVDMQKFRAGFLNQDERHRLHVGLSDVVDSRLRFYDSTGVTMSEICATIRRQVQEEGLHLAIIDYLQLIQSHGESENRNQEVSRMSRQLKMLANEVQIPIIVLSQLSRQTDRRGDPKPMLSDLRDSGSLEQDADLVAFIFREEMHKRDREDLRGIAELIIAKQRNGPIGSVPLRFLKQFVRFENRAEDLPDPGGQYNIGQYDR